jgi:hypothetical protein
MGNYWGWTNPNTTSESWIKSDLKAQIREATQDLSEIIDGHSVFETYSSIHSRNGSNSGLSKADDLNDTKINVYSDYKKNQLSTTAEEELMTSRSSAKKHDKLLLKQKMNTFRIGPVLMLNDSEVFLMNYKAKKRTLGLSFRKIRDIDNTLK